jgi:hypothetical protein
MSERAAAFDPIFSMASAEGPMKTIPGVDRHGADPELPAGPDDPHRDFAAIRDQDFLEHGRPPGRVTKAGL